MHQNSAAEANLGRAAGPAPRAILRTLAPTIGAPVTDLPDACTPIRGAALRRLTSSQVKEALS